MNIESRIKSMKTAALRKIEDAARTGKTSLVVSNSKIIEQIESAERNYDQIVNSLNMVENALNQKGKVIDISQISSPIDVTGKKLSPKKKAELKRTEFTDHLNNLGLNAMKIKGVRYKVNNKNSIGVAFANEINPNRWFLGLPPEKFDTIVLLCEMANGQVLSFVFSSEFFHKHKNNFSSDQAGQIKFNVTKRNSQYYLTIPQIGNENITSFLNNFANLTNL